MPVTMNPTPPTACNIARHRMIPRGVESSPDITVDPVVVIPDIDSNNASTGDSVVRYSGTAPASAAVTHTEDVSRKPCRRCMFSNDELEDRVSAMPTNPVSSADMPKAAAVSGKTSASTAISAAENSSTRPFTKITKFTHVPRV